MREPKFYRMFGYDTKILPNSHLADLEDGVNSIDEARKMTGATIGYPGWGLIYHLLLSHLDRSREEIIIETGTNFGCTTIVLAQALIDAKALGRVITFELVQENMERARANWQAAGVIKRIESHTGDSRENLPKTLASMSLR